MSQNTPSFFLKRFSGFLHFIFALIALTGVGFMYLNSNYGRGLDWIEDETFDQSPDFNKKVQADIASIFDYIQYQELFETNGEVDYNKMVLDGLLRPRRRQELYPQRHHPIRKVPGLLYG